MRFSCSIPSIRRYVIKADGRKCRRIAQELAFGCRLEITHPSEDNIMHKTFASAVLLASALGLAACEKTSEDNKTGSQPTNEQAQGAVSSPASEQGVKQELAPAARASDEKKP